MRSLLHQLILGLWAIRPDAVDGWMVQVNDIVYGRNNVLQLDSEGKAADQPLVVAGISLVSMEGDEYPLRSDAPVPAMQGLVAVVHINGPIMKDDFCGDLGMLTLAKWYQSFERTPEVVGIVEVMDTPGGHGNAMAALCAQKGRMSKPVVTLVEHGMACSAGYGIAATSDLVFASSEIDEFGSVGTYLTIRDYSGMDEARGVKTHTIIATRSTQKLAAYQEALQADNKDPNDPKYKALREQRVDPFNEAFIDMVERARPGLKGKEGVFEGQVYTAKKAMELGMIDAIDKTLDDAVAAVRELATNKKSNN
jgi:ClpP class serine protease